MRENGFFDFTCSTRAIFSLSDVRCKDSQIQPHEVSDKCVGIVVVMRLGSEFRRDYLCARIVYSDDEYEAGHHVEILLKGRDGTDKFKADWAIASPGNLHDTMQAVCETYIDAVEGWYANSLAAEEAGEGR